MSKEGFYSIQFRGSSDYGFGVIILDTNMVIGADVGGVLYDGNYTLNDNTHEIDLNVTLTVPAGIALVMGVPPRHEDYTIPIVTSIPRDLGQEKPVLLQTDFGPVNVIFKKIRDFPQ
ncbi:MAG: hypothetical protein HQL67_12470 [Magnetococcales bacterium]|nr:hypothetical protein [Magnetococcales bacterium]